MMTNTATVAHNDAYAVETAQDTYNNKIKC